jgi:hypothetical protein
MLAFGHTHNTKAGSRMLRPPGLAVLLLACATTTAAAQKPKPLPPLAPFVSEHLIVLPVQLMRADSAGWLDGARWGAFRKELDDSIASAIAERGLGKKWAYAADVVRSAKRNAAYTSDPYSLGAQAMRGVPLKTGDKLPTLFNSNLRTLIALGDTRYALVPIELAFFSIKDSNARRAALRLALVDGRGGVYVWIGDVASDPATSLTPAMIGSLAARVADLVQAP